MTDERKAFESWLCEQMPAGTVIGDPKWWAEKLWRQARGAQQEPVAWMRDPNSVMTAGDKKRMIEHGEKHGREFAIVAADAMKYATPLYTSPPAQPDAVTVPREWTDAQMSAAKEMAATVRKALGEGLSDESLFGAVYDAMIAAQETQ